MYSQDQRNINIMQYELRSHYGRRITPGVKLFILIAIVVLGLYLAFNDMVDHYEQIIPIKTTVNVILKT